MLKLTAQNQGRRLAEDSERVHQGRSTDFSIGQHIELLIRRVEALERRDSDASSTEDRESGLSGEAVAARADEGGIAQ